MSKKRKGITYNPNESSRLTDDVSGQQVIGALPNGSWILGAPAAGRMPVKKIEDMRLQETIAYVMTLINIGGA